MRRRLISKIFFVAGAALMTGAGALSAVEPFNRGLAVGVKAARQQYLLSMELRQGLAFFVGYSDLNCAFQRDTSFTPAPQAEVQPGDDGPSDEGDDPCTPSSAIKIGETIGEEIASIFKAMGIASRPTSHSASSFVLIEASKRRAASGP